MVQTGSGSSTSLYDENTLRTFELVFQQPNWWKQLTDNYAAKNWLKADLKVDGTVYKHVGVRFRGRSSYWGARIRLRSAGSAVANAPSRGEKSPTQKYAVSSSRSRYVVLKCCHE